MKTILFWTRWYQRTNGFLDLGFGTKLFKSCPVSNCQVTDNRKRFKQSQAVMFHMQPGDFRSRDLPRIRSHRQRFIFFFFEPLIYSNRPVFESAPAHFFNWTFTYRRSADIPSNHYGDYKLKADSFQRKIEGKYEGEESLDNYHGINVTGKTVMAAWFSSHCPTDVKREAYVAELQKHIRVDVYGACGNLTCYRKPKHLESDDCNALITRDYLFYLSFENSICPDYVTEKLYRPLREGAVPVVFGGAHYTRFAPPHSYINALEFSSVKHLADHLIMLSENRRLYAHYLDWRRHFRVIKEPMDGWCKLCEMLHADLPAKTYPSIARWWFDDYTCQENSWNTTGMMLSPETV